MSNSFRLFKVVNKVIESTVITSFYLQPEDNEPLWPAQAGQYLTLRIPTDASPLLRTYSLSSDVSHPDSYRISVKREAAPMASNIPDGVGSCWLHDEVEVGDTLEVAAPRGHFILDDSSQRPVLLLSGGVGQTPLLSMLHSLSKTSREAWYIHACENGEVHAMQAEVDDLVSQCDQSLQSIVVYREPSAQDHEAKNFDGLGFIDKALLQSLLPIDDYDVYLCGPTTFMVAMYKLLVELGFTKSRIAYEFFGKAASLDSLAFGAVQESKAPSMAASKAPSALANLIHITNPDAWAIDKSFSAANTVSTNSNTNSSVCFSHTGKTVEWSDINTSLLQLAEQHGLNPDFSCRSGICNSCKLPLLEGEVEYFEPPLEQPNSNEVLLCCSRPLGRVVIDL